MKKEQGTSKDDTKKQVAAAAVKMKQEMSRGIITIAVMSELQQPHYGYSLQKRFEEIGLSISQDTLYPLLRRLDTQHMLDSDWVVEDPRPRKYYTLSPFGRQVLQELKEEWQNMVDTIGRILI